MRWNSGFMLKLGVAVGTANGISLTVVGIAFLSLVHGHGATGLNPTYFSELLEQNEK
jgi:hypothetical protein